MAQREQWKSQWGFIVAALGSAVGLGNIWRFSYVAYENGGGAFLLPYVIALLVTGIPLLILEFGIGHERIGSAPLAFAKYKKQWEWLGWWAIVFIMFGIELYYSVVISWCINYFSIAFDLGWGSNPQDFFMNQFLHVTKDASVLGDIQYDILTGLAIVWGVSWFITYRGVTKGLETANKIFIPLLLILMAVLVFWSFTLEGAVKGLEQYFYPDFNKLRDPKVWVTAFGQVFFSLSLGFGIMITYASYLPEKSDLTRSSIITGLMDSAFAIFAGVAVFAVLGFMEHSGGTAIKDVNAGPGLAFVAYPQALNIMAEQVSPIIGRVFGVLFFLALIFAGFSSSISIIEAFVSAIIDKFHVNRKLAVSIISIIGFLGGIIFTTGAGLHWLDIVDHYINQYGLIMVGLLECLIVGWFFQISLLRLHINEVSSFRLGEWWSTTIKVIIPVILSLILAGAFWKELENPYGGEWYYIGLIWLGFTVIIAIILAAMKWRFDIDNHESRSDRLLDK